MRVTHPRFPDVTREVDEARVESWVDAGWAPDLLLVTVDGDHDDITSPSEGD